MANTAAGGTSSSIKYYEKFSDDWYEIGSTSWASATSGDFQFASHLSVPTLQSDGVSALTSGDVFVQRTTPNTGASLSVKLFSATSKTFSAVASPVYASTDAAYTDIGLANVKVGDVVAITGSSAELTLKRHNGNSTVVANGGNISAGVDVSGNSSIQIVYNGTTVNVTLANTISGNATNSTAEDAVFDINAGLSGAGVTEVVASEGPASNVVLIQAQVETLQ